MTLYILLTQSRSKTNIFFMLSSFYAALKSIAYKSLPLCLLGGCNLMKFYKHHPTTVMCPAQFNPSPPKL